MVQISKQSISDNKSRSRPDITVLKTPSNATPISIAGQGCFANNGCNRCLVILVTFLFGIAITYLDIFPDLKARKAAAAGGGNGGNGDVMKVHNLKGSGKSSSGGGDPSMILSPNELKNNIQSKNKPQDNKEKNQDGKKKDTSKVMDKEKKSIYDDNWDPKHNCNYECKTDRLANEINLYAGEALCNHQYRFGMTQGGDFVAHDCDSNVKQVFYKNNKGDKIKKGEKVYFKLKEDGTMRVVSKEADKEKTILYEQKPKRKVYSQAQCLEKPALPCPYLHLRETGLVVLNWIDQETNDWMDRYVDRIYPELYPKEG
ncbi:unnamed protein product [Cylindrotheca closterium]|uniref:Uncharacterized protein n=1 Tax=Cylindrotheca closterium TaxID=2856 RepID=A0AAD2FPH5_9STRA|nr:unnamed protein product [Cylindrotheca closterium]